MTKQLPAPTPTTQRFDAETWRSLVGPGYQFSTMTERAFEPPWRLRRR